MLRHANCEPIIGTRGALSGRKRRPHMHDKRGTRSYKYAHEQPTLTQKGLRHAGTPSADRPWCMALRPDNCRQERSAIQAGTCPPFSTSFLTGLTERGTRVLEANARRSPGDCLREVVSKATTGYSPGYTTHPITRRRGDSYPQPHTERCSVEEGFIPLCALIGWIPSIRSRSSAVVGVPGPSHA